LPTEAQAEMVQHIIQFNLSGRQVQEICERSTLDESDIGAEVTPHIRRFIKSMQKIHENNEQEFLRDLLQQEQSPELAWARIENTISFLIRIRDRLKEG
jgi:hypothetical protein